MSQPQSESAEPAHAHVIVGSGPDALLAAAVLAHRGQRVHLVQTGPSASGLEHPDLPLGRGRMRVDPAQRALVEAILGPLVEAPSAHQGIQLRGTRRQLPLSRVEAGRLLAPEQALATGRTWARTRFRNAMAEVIGGGQEERTYRDWVVRRFGEPAWFHLYRAYAENRWGAGSDELSVSVARVYHGLVDDSPEQVAGGGSAAALAHAEAIILGEGGRISTGVGVEGLVLEDGKPASLQTSLGELPLAGRLITTSAPDVVVGWLGDEATESLRVDCAGLRMLTRVQVMLRGNVDGLPQALHVLDDGAPFWRVVTPYGLEQAAVFHATFPSASAVPDHASLVSRFRDEAERLGVGQFSSEGARVEVIDDWQPLWLEGTHRRVRRVLMAWRQLGIVGLGRGGAFGDLDPSEQIAFADHLAQEPEADLWEYHRLRLSPPSTLPDLHAHITRFVER